MGRSVMSHTLWGVVSSAALACVAAASAEPLPSAELLMEDDECAGDESQDCTLNALQLRGIEASAADDPAPVPSAGALPKDEGSEVDEDEDGAVYIDLPADWDSSKDYPPKSTEEGAEHGDAEPKNAVDLANGGHCQYNPRGHSCYISRACHGPRYCVLGNYMIVPGFPCAGMEAINGGNAGKFDYLMGAAKSRCGSTSCVLITNPIHHRTQDQMHIHYRHYNGGGHHLKTQLEHKLCGTHGWQDFHKCGHAKARLYNGFPGVFSAVAGAYGGGSLANVGIAVFFTTKCGGYKTIILATTHCSIEHSISSR